MVLNLKQRMLNFNFEVVQGAQVEFTECSTLLNMMLNFIEDDAQLE